MQDHHRELTVHFAEREALSAYTAAMSSAGYADELEPVVTRPPNSGFAADAALAIARPAQLKPGTFGRWASTQTSSKAAQLAR